MKVQPPGIVKQQPSTTVQQSQHPKAINFYKSSIPLPPISNRQSSNQDFPEEPHVKSIDTICKLQDSDEIITKSLDNMSISNDPIQYFKKDFDKKGM